MRPGIHYHSLEQPHTTACTMKKFYVLILILFCITAAFNAKASHCAGGELIYQWVSDSTYRVTFKLYRDCAGTSAEPPNVPVCCENSCNLFAPPLTLQKLTTLPDGSPNGTEVSSGCGGSQSTCLLPGSTVPGFQEWWYQGLITLPGRCSDWTFSVSISARNTSANLSGGSNNLFYVATTLNSVVAQGNSSPIFSVKPVPYVCINNPYTYNNGVIDPDNDSLGYEIMQPQQGSCSAPASPIPFNGTNLYNTTNNPIPTGNSFVFNATTGQMSFTPTQTGKNTLTVRVKEYRNHVLIGSVTRDIQVQTLACNSVQPVLNADSITITSGTRVNGRIENCAGTPLNFCFKVKSPNAGAIMVASDNHLIVTPGSVVTYTGQRTDSIMGCFSWTPGALDTGLRNFAVTVKDSTCLSGIAISQTFVVPIYIYSVTKISKDSTICAGGSVPLQATGGSTFTWSVLPGGSPLSTLSCTNCSNPTASPTVTTRYVVTTNLQSICNKSTDTVKITVNQLPPAPTIITNSPVCVGDSLRFTTPVNATSYSWLGPAGFHSTLQSPLIANAQTPNGGLYYLIVKNGNCASPAASVNVSIASTPAKPIITGDDTLCQGETIDLHVTTNAGFFKWTGPNGFASTANHVTFPNAAPLLSGKYILKVYNAVTLACPSPADTFDVLVSPKITVSFDVSRDTLCEHDTINVISTGTNDPTMHYNWNFVHGNIQSGTGAGPYIIQYPSQGLHTIYLNANNGGCKDSAKHNIRVVTAPISDFLAPQDACMNDTIRVMGDALLSYDWSYNWSFDGAYILSGTKVGPYYLRYNTPGAKVVTLTTTSNYCSSIETRHIINVHALPIAHIVSASSTNNICAGELIHFIAADNEDNTYQWLPASFFAVGGAVTDGRVRETGYVKLLVTDTLGCRSEDSIYITAKHCCTVTLPNAFTPNNDGHNDLFRLVTAGYPLNVNFRIFNRWGQEIYSTGEASNGWDGTSGGKQMDAGTYYYYVRYQCTDQQYYELKGEVILIR